MQCKVQQLQRAVIEAEKQRELALAESAATEQAMALASTDIENEVTVMKARVEKYETMARDIASQLTLTVQTNSKLVADVQQAQAANADLQRELEMATQALEETRASFSALQIQANAVQVEKDKTLQELNVATESLNKFTSTAGEAAVIKAEGQRAMTRIEELTRQLQAHQEAAAIQLEDQQRLSSANQQLAIENASLAGRVTELTAVCDKLSTDLSAAVSRINAEQLLSQSRQNEHSAAMAALKADQLVEIKKMKDQVKTFSQQVLVLESEKRLCEASIKAKEQQIAALELHLKSNSEQSAQLIQEAASRTQEEVESTSLHAHKLETEIQALNESLQRSHASKSSLEESLRAVETRVQSLQRDLIAATSTNQELVTTNQALAREMSMLQHNHSTEEVAVVSLQSRLAEQATALELKQQQLDAHEKAAAQLYALEAKHSALLESFRDVQAQLHTQAELHRAATTQHENDAAALHDQLLQQDVVLRDLQARHDVAAMQLVNVQQELKEWQHKANIMAEQNDQLNDVIRRLQENADSSQTVILQLEANTTAATEQLEAASVRECTTGRASSALGAADSGVGIRRGDCCRHHGLTHSATWRDATSAP
jgi:chromosome segregation ATPase